MRTVCSLLRPALVGAALFTLSAAPLVAQSASSDTATGIRRELIIQVTDAERKLVALAEAMPADKYGWRPAPGVRSVSEVFMHMVGANYMIPGFAGATRATGISLTPASEKTVTDKAEVVDHLRKSFVYVKGAMLQVPDAELDAMVSMFERRGTKRAVLVLIASHAHEHLGQAIAYARQNGVVPPWSQAGGGDR